LPALSSTTGQTLLITLLITPLKMPPNPRKQPPRFRANSRMALGLFIVIVGQRHPPTPHAADAPAVAPMRK